MDETLNTLQNSNGPEDIAEGSELATSPEVAGLSSDLLRDFYQTFRLAQGETTVQPPLFVYLAIKHNEAGHQSLIGEAIDQADSKVDTLLPPARHVETNEQQRQNSETGFRVMWSEYAEALTDSSPVPRRSIELVLEDMLAVDLRYQDEERPNRTNSDPHESMVREYILGDKLTGSQQLMQVRDDFRASVLSLASSEDDTFAAKKMHDLVKAWEEKHQGISFYENSEALAEAA